jgi:hypothetical protein
MNRDKIAQWFSILSDNPKAFWIEIWVNGYDNFSEDWALEYKSNLVKKNKSRHG